MAACHKEEVGYHVTLESEYGSLPQDGRRLVYVTLGRRRLNGGLPQGGKEIGIGHLGKEEAAGGQLLVASDRELPRVRGHSHGFKYLVFKYRRLYQEEQISWNSPWLLTTLSLSTVLNQYCSGP
jgi:hypothetical protein